MNAARSPIPCRTSSAQRPAAAAAAVLALIAVAAARQPSPEVVYESAPATWFEHLTRAARISPDGRLAVIGEPSGPVLVPLVNGARDERLRGPVGVVHDAVFASDGRLMRLAEVDQQRRWHYEDGTLLDVPGDAVPVPSPDGSRMAYVSPTERAIVHVDGQPRSFDAPVLGIQWTPDGARLVALLRRVDYQLTLAVLEPRSGNTRIVADALDGDVYPARFAVASRGGRQLAVLGLVGPTPPDPAARHDPHADRDLDLWTVDLENGHASRIVERPGDDFAPVVVGEHLFWTHADLRPSVILAPTTGGPARELVSPGELPSWRPDGRQLAFTIGGWRLRDVALPLDVHAIDLDGDARPLGAPRPLITGYHEDFSPAWSPDGQWLVFHSHRSPSPVVSYAAAGSTDDLWIARASDPQRTEARLTDFGHEVGMADWSPDGRRLVFVTRSRQPPGLSRAWVVTIDPSSGRRIDAQPLSVPSSVATAETVAWSPDGRTIALESKVDARRRELWLYRLSDGTARRLVEYEAVTFGGVDWTPDGRAVVFGALAGSRMQLFTVDVATGRSRQQLTNVEGASVFLPQVSPDGRVVAATAMRHTRQVRRLPWR